MTTKTLITADELLLLSREQRCELIEGELVEMSPSGSQHCYVHLEIAYRIRKSLETDPLGKVFGAEMGFWVKRNPDTVRAPDVAFITNERLPTPLPTGYFPGPPDLAVEVISPRDTSTEVTEKVAMWLQAGTKQVWTVDPLARIAMIHHLEDGYVVARQTMELHCEELLPGLRIPLAEILR